MSRTAQARGAVIGAGLMGRWHASAIHRIGGRVTLIVDPNESAAAALASRHRGARVTRTLDLDMVADLATAAHVCTPLDTHVSIAGALIGAGVHTLVEKPLTRTAEQTNAILAQATTRGVLVWPVHQFLFQHGVIRLLSWLPALGTIRRVEFSACSAGARPGESAKDALIGEILPHPLALVAAILGTALGHLEWSVFHPAAGEFRAVAGVGDAVVDLAISANARPTENVLRVLADRGSVTADLFHGFAVRTAPTVSRRAKVLAPFLSSGRQFGDASVNLLRRIGRREPAYPGLRDLVREFYAAVSNPARAMRMRPSSIVDVAVTRDLLLRGSRLPG